MKSAVFAIIYSWVVVILPLFGSLYLIKYIMRYTYKYKDNAKCIKKEN